MARRHRGDPSALSEAARRAFVAAATPHIGDACAESFFLHWAERYPLVGDGQDALDRLGDIGAFVADQWDDATMRLDQTDWSSFRDILSAEAESLDLDVLSRMMTFLVERGALDD